MPNPSDLYKYKKTYHLQNEEADCKNVISQEFGDENIDISEYSIFGWFKASAKMVTLMNKPLVTIMNLANNKEEIKAL